MRKFTFFIAALALSSFGLNAQNAHNHDKCGSDHVLQESLKNPEHKQSYERFLQAARDHVNNPEVEVTRDAYGTRIIPVVFHILHKGGNGNISKEQIDDQIRILNEDFQRMNPDTTNTPPRFWGKTEQVEMLFNGDDINSFNGEHSYVRFGNRYGTIFGAHFNDGAAASDSITNIVDQMLEININGSDDTAAIAMAFANAVDGLAGINATYLFDGDHKVLMVGDSLGFAEDPQMFGLPLVGSTVLENGALFPGRMNLEFRLAHKDPLGNCTEGVVRVFTSKSEQARNPTGFKAESYWTATKYLNVWVINSIAPLGNTGGTTLGYAQFPASGLLSTDGIAVRNDQIGSIGTAGPVGAIGRTAVHEVGHWLSLIHVWGDATCGNDEVADTPSALGPNFGICGSLTVNQFLTTPLNLGDCDPDNPDGEMANNYMDYSNDNCVNMFTIGQVARMNFTLHGAGGEEFGVRSELIAPFNNEFTGTADPYAADPGCTPIADFYFEPSSFFATQQMICEGESVDFEDHSYNGHVDSWNWSFDGGSPGSSTSQDETVTYNSAGVYDVSLNISGDNGSDDKTIEDYVIVSSNTADYNGSSWGYVEAFWDSAQFANDYYIFNHDGEDAKWEWFNAPEAGFGTDEVVRMRNFGNFAAEVDELITPSFDLTGVADARLKFRYTGAAINSTPEDQLDIFVSDDCGESWSPRGSLDGFDLANNGLADLPYVPNAGSQWDVEELTLGNASDQPNVRFKFRWTSGGMSNNFYIDNITVSGGVIGVEEREGLASMKLAPNPATDVTRVTLDIASKSEVSMQLLDLVGKTVRDLYAGELAPGSFNMDVDVSGLESGVYLMKVNVNGQLITERVVVE